MIDFIQTHIRLVIGVIVTLFIATIVWSFVYLFVIFHVVSVIPDGSVLSKYQPEIIITFNKPVSDHNLEVLFANKKQEVTVRDNQIRFVVRQNMDDGKKYNLVLKKIQSNSGDIIKDQIFSFTASSDSSLITPEQDKRILKEQDDKTGYFTDPIMEFLPYETLDYTVSGVEQENGKILVEITISLTAADIRTDRQAAIDQYISDAMTYLKNLPEIQIKDYEIKTTVIDPV